MKNLTMGIGVAATALGLLFAGQGFGLIRWPASSFMIDATRWITYGAGIVAVGVLLLVRSRKR